MASPNMTPKLVSVQAPLALTLAVDAAGNQDRVYSAVLLRPGIYTPGIGAGGDRILFPADVLERLAPTLEGKPVNLEHSTDLEDEVGFLRNVRWQDQSIRGDIVLQAKRPKFTDAVGFIEGRMAAGQVPNVSVEFMLPVYALAQNPGELASFDRRLVDAKEIQGAAVLSRGACNQDAGCGIGLSEHMHPAATPATPGFPVPRPQGQGQNDGEPPMCDDHKALQARVTALEAEKKKDADAAAVKLQEKADSADALQLKLTAAEAELKDYRDAEVTALQEALKEAAPEGLALKELVGDKPTVPELRLALKALRAGKPKAPEGAEDDETPAAKLGAGRRTKAAPSEAGAKPSGDKLLALRERYGVKTGYDKMPPKLKQAVNGMLTSAAKEGRQTA